MDNKKLALSSAVALTVLVGAHGVHADEVKAPLTSATATEEVATEAQATTPEVQQPTEAQVNEAKSALDSANESVSSQEVLVAQDQAKVNTAQDMATETQAKEDQAQQSANSATPEAIEGAEQDVTAKSQAVSNSETALSNAEQVSSDAKKAVDEQKANVDKAQEQVDADQAVVNAKKENVDNAQKVLDGTGADEVVATRDEKQAQVKADQSNVSTLETKVEDSKKADAKNASDLASAKENLATDKTATSTAKTNLDSATTTASQTQAKVTETKTGLTEAQNAAKGINTFPVSQAYVDALNAYWDAEIGSAEEATYKEALIAAGKELRNTLITPSGTLLTYKSNPDDKNIVFSDINNIPTEYLTEFSLYMSDLINDIRSAFGTFQTTVSKGSVAVADKVTDRYVADNWSWTDVVNTGHDMEALEEAGANDENLNTWGTHYKSITFDLLKQLGYEALIDYMYNNYEWGHATSISGVRSNVLRPTSLQVGADISTDNATRTSIHVNFVGDGANEDFPAGYDSTVLENPKSATALKANLAKAQNAYNQAVSNNNTAQSKLATVKTAYNNALADQQDSQAKVDELSAYQSQTASLSSQLADAKSKLATDTKALEEAQKAVDTLNASIKEKMKVLEEAKAQLQQAENTLNASKATLTTEKGKLEVVTNAYTGSVQDVKDAKTAVSNAKQALADAQDYLESLKNAPALLEEAKKANATAQQNLADALAKLEADTALLNELKAQQKDAQEAYNKVKASYDAYMKALAEAKHQAELAKQLADIEAKGGVPVPVVAQDGSIERYVDGAEAPATQLQKVRHITKMVSNEAIARRGTSSTYQASLPLTGEKDIAIFNILGIVMIGLASYGIKRKRS
ncbi:TPA: SEC10/PgrA surface exclusion domain-containing protein [Streptococcus agalactiae]